MSLARTIRKIKMKGTLLSASITLSTLMAAASPYFDNITNLWYQAQHSNVLAIANQRLAANSNDLAGVILKASWDFEFSNASILSNSLNRLVTLGRACHSPSFTNEFQITVEDVTCTLQGLSLETPSQLAEDAAKRGLPGKQMHFMEELKALDDDGYFCVHPNP